MHHLYLLPFIPDAQYRGGAVLDNQLAFLQGGDGGFQVVEFFARHAEQVADYAVGDALLLHNQRILRVGVEVERLALEIVHVLCGQDDAQSLVSAYSYKIAQRSVVETEHIVRLVDNGEMAYLHQLIRHGLLLQLLVDVVQF